MRKGITPIISIIILLLITVALAGAAWTYLSGFMGTYTEKSFKVVEGSTYCSSAGMISLTVVNTGTSTITTGDWTTKNVDPACGATTILTVPSSVSPRATGTINITGCIPPGTSYTLHIGTIGGTQHPTVTC